MLIAKRALFPENITEATFPAAFNQTIGNTWLAPMILGGSSAAEIMDAYQNDLNDFMAMRTRNRLYVASQDTSLQGAIDVAASLEQGNASNMAWRDLLRALATGRALLLNPGATQGQIDDAADRLWAAINALEDEEVPAGPDKAALLAAIAEANELNQTNYTPLSWRDLLRALAVARSTLINPQLTQDMIDFATDNLTIAIEGLVERP